MTKKVRATIQKIISLYLVFTLFTAQLFPFFGLVSDVYATSQVEIAQSQLAQEISTVSFDAQSHELVISLTDSQVETEYAVFYQVQERLDGAQGTFSDGSARVFLGTKSGEDAVKATPSRIIVKTKSGNFGKTIQIEADIAQIVANQAEDTTQTELSFISYSTDSLELTSSEQLWVQHGTYIVETVQQDTKYSYPANDAVSVTFTSLPETAANLSIKEITLSDEVVAEVGALSSTAYEITSSMENGTFSYDLTLPNPTESQDVQVQFSENGEDFEEAQPEELAVENKDDKSIVKISGLDHFTVFVVTSPTPDTSVAINTLTITPADTAIWISELFPNASGNPAEVTFVEGPTTPPNMSKGSVRLATPNAAGRKAIIKSNAFVGTSLSDITTFTYDTYVAQRTGNVGLYANIFIDRDGNGTMDHRLDFEPGSQVVLNTWQTWDLTEVNFSVFEIVGGSWQSRPNTTLSQIVSSYPNAKIAPFGLFSLAFNAGDTGAGNAYTNAIMYLDNVVFNSTAYDFEPISDFTAKIQGRVFTDTDATGYQYDSTIQPNKNGWKVNLYDEDWSLVDSQISGTSGVGQYAFDELDLGLYRVCQEMQLDWKQTSPVLDMIPVTLASTATTQVQVDNGARGVMNMSPNSAKEGYHCWQVTVSEDDEYDEYGFLKFGSTQLPQPQYGDIEVCKVDTSGNPLQGWEFVLGRQSGSIPSSSLNVADPLGTVIHDMPKGMYEISVSGTYNYRSSPSNARKADAGFSQRNEANLPEWLDGYNWVMDGNSARGLSLRINDVCNTQDCWDANPTSGLVYFGHFNPLHTYTTYYNHPGGDMKFSTRDSNYADNTSGNLSVVIKTTFSPSEQISDVTDETGCVLFENVYPGEYTLTETLQDEWHFINRSDGKQNGAMVEVVANETTEVTFTNLPYLDAPVQIGYNVNNGAGDNGSTPRPEMEIACTEGYTNINGAAIHWTHAGGPNIKFQRQYSTNGINWSGSEIYSNQFTNFRTFGGNGGTDGTYHSRVRAFYDVQNNNQVNSGDPVSPWSNDCSITFDKTAPTNPGTPIPTPTSPTNVLSQVWNWTPATDTISGVTNYFIAFVEGIGGSAADILGAWTDNGLLTSANTNFGEGVWKFFVKAVDKAGNESEIVESAEYVVDTTAPDAPTWITSPFITRLGDVNKAGDNQGANIKFAASVSEDVASYQYQYVRFNLDGTYVGSSTNVSINPSICSGGICSWNSVTLEKNKMWIYRLRAIDHAGNPSSWTDWNDLDNTQFVNLRHQSVSFNDFTNKTGAFSEANGYGNGSTGFTIREEVAPTSQITSPDSSGGTIITANTSIEIDYSADDVDTEVEEVALFVSNDAGTTFTKAHTSSTGQFVYEFPADGEYCFYTQATDSANMGVIDAGVGNYEPEKGCELTVLHDNTIPSSTITGPGVADSENPNTIYVNNWDGSVLGTAVDPDPSSGLAGVELSIQRDSDGMYWNGSDWVEETDPSAPIRVITSSDDNWATWSYQVTGLINQNTYTIISKAFDIAGNKENSAKLIIVLDKTIPEVNISVDPTNPDGANNWYKTRPTITLTEGDSFSGIKSIQYSWNNQNGPWNTYVAPFQIPSEGSYILYYRAINNADVPSETGIKNLAWDQTALTQGPLNVKADPDRTSGSTSKITWTAATDNIGIDKYEIIWKLKNGSTQYSKSVNGSTFETTIDQMTIEGEWEVIVKAFDQVGNSKEASTTVNIDKTAPAAPVLTLTGTAVGSASLSWEAVADASRYIVYYGVNSGEYIFAASVGNVTSYTVQGLAAGNYYFMVRAVDSVDNQSANSNEVNSGTIGGVAGANPLTPVEGFAPAGEVLGDQDQSLEDVAQNGGAGSVAGTTDEQCSALRTNLPWILLGILVLGGMLIEVLLKRQTGLAKFAISGGLFVSTLLAYYLLRNTNCVDSGSILSLVSTWFWVIAAVIAGLIRLVGYAFLEEVEL